MGAGGSLISSLRNATTQQLRNRWSVTKDRKKNILTLTCSSKNNLPECDESSCENPIEKKLLTMIDPKTRQFHAPLRLNTFKYATLLEYFSEKKEGVPSVIPLDHDAISRRDKAKAEKPCWLYNICKDTYDHDIVFGSFSKSAYWSLKDKDESLELIVIKSTIFEHEKDQFSSDKDHEVIKYRGPKKSSLKKDLSPEELDAVASHLDKLNDHLSGSNLPDVHSIMTKTDERSTPPDLPAPPTFSDTSSSLPAELKTPKYSPDSSASVSPDLKKSKELEDSSVSVFPDLKVPKELESASNDLPPKFLNYQPISVQSYDSLSLEAPPSYQEAMMESPSHQEAITESKNVQKSKPTFSGIVNFLLNFFLK